MLNFHVEHYVNKSISAKKNFSSVKLRKNFLVRYLYCAVGRYKRRYDSLYRIVGRGISACHLISEGKRGGARLAWPEPALSGPWPVQIRRAQSPFKRRI
jgi:hypothetical protein